ncbi:unnamed protein product [Vitrella brassicaformis CCMP3155]|uniref:Transmembrane protein n=1 Tax=Vitrella brassicaformis (strain CCMP3155) TaxID=1169540 RepID=A0A0G4EJ75_VITBC|nr:unnamed protein product [Vitrella brassicaformis CCMP3155]|eukprot:CEL96587.1 unnamed protein product [Vitrella brassicaformis CCMP3155]
MSTHLPDIDEEGAQGPPVRAEEMAIQAMKTEFEKAAGYPAAFEEFESHLVYEPGVMDDGQTTQVREVLIGTRFSPEPFMRSLQRAIRAVVLQVLYAFVLALPMVVWPLAFWHTCKSERASLVIAYDYVRNTITFSVLVVYLLAIAEGHQGSKLFSRFKKTWFYFLLPAIARVAFTRLFVVPGLWPYAVALWGFEHICYIVLIPLTFVSSAGVFLWVAIFGPRGERAATDTERTRVAFTCLMSFWPLVALVNGTVRKMRDGPPLYNHAAAHYLVLGCCVAPRLLQAEMAALSSKIMSSLLFAFYDLIGDLAVPYADILHANVARWLTRTCNGQSTKPTRKTRCPNADRDRHIAHVADLRSNKTIATVTSNKKGTAASYSCVSSEDSRRSSSEVYQSVVRAGRRMRSTKSALDLQSNFIAFDVRPRYLRALRDQQYGYNQAESLILIVINLSLISMEQLLSPFSLSRLLERLGGLCLLVVIEMACETVFFMVQVRWHNLPMLRAEEEPGVVKFRLLTLFAVGTSLFASFSPWLVLFFLRTLPSSVYGDVTLLEFCPQSAHPNIARTT